MRLESMGSEDPGPTLRRENLPFRAVSCLVEHKPSDLQVETGTWTFQFNGEGGIRTLDRSCLL